MEIFVISVLCFLSSLAGFPVMWVVEWLEGRRNDGKR